ncbi:MAG: glycosyltransferase, partial [Leptolyngbyaceae cyanobacterium CRU_2_3]|nr:glycosyltransferase [Leptolyngbyaceae cyanobacterium CRU_2_3]
EVYGNPDGWKHLRHAYKGAIPYDGESVLSRLHQAGVGLCLHREEHRQAALPSMRIFEIVASGAIALCGEHPFIRATFGDHVLYLDPDAGETEQLHQIADHMQWIKHHPDTAVAMSAKAHQIFLEHYALEKLLSNLLCQHQAFIQQQRDFLNTTPPVQIILRYDSEAPDALIDTLDQIAEQTYPHCSVMVVKSPGESLDPLLQDHATKLPIQVIEADPTYASSQLWAGLRAIDSDYFTLLNAGDFIYPDHIATLVALLHQHPNVGVAYSGGLDRSRPENSPETSEPFIYFSPSI